MANSGCCKFSSFLVNCLVFIGGLLLLLVGIWFHVEGGSFKQVVANDPAFFNVIIVVIAVGCFLIMVGFLGCYGVAKENRRMLGVFFVLVLIIFVSEIVGVALGFSFYPIVKEEALNSIKYYEDGNLKGQIITAGWKALQETLQCCGLNGIDDWKPVLERSNSTSLPPPCDTQNFTSTPKIPGCEEALKKYFWVLGGIGGGTLMTEILAMVFTCCVYQNAGE